MQIPLDLHSLDDQNSLRSWRSLGTWHFAEKVAKTSGIMALAAVFGVGMLAHRPDGRNQMKRGEKATVRARQNYSRLRHGCAASPIPVRPSADHTDN